MRSRRRTLIPIAIASLLLGMLLCWLSPWAAPLRYRRMSLVALNRIVEREPDNRLAWRELGLRLAHDGDGALSEPALRRALALDATDAEVATGLGEILLSRGEYPEAFQVLKTAVEHRPDYPLARMALGRLYRRRGSYHHAAEQFEVVARRHRDYPDAWRELAVCYLQMQQVARASDAIGRALAQNPKEPEYLEVRAATEAAVGRVDTALASLQRAGELAPRSAIIQARLASMLLAHHRGDADLALATQAADRLEGIDPTYPLLPYLRGQLAVFQHDWGAAVHHLEQAREATPDQPEVYYALSQAYRRVGRRREAEQMLARYRRQQDLQRRIDAVRIKLTMEQDQIPLYCQLSELQFQAGDLRGAKESLANALQLDPGDARAQRQQRRLERLSARTGPR
jgi:tetratricopeptide (TPR) repeat protein